MFKICKQKIYIALYMCYYFNSFGFESTRGLNFENVVFLSTILNKIWLHCKINLIQENCEDNYIKHTKNYYSCEC